MVLVPCIMKISNKFSVLLKNGKIPSVSHKFFPNLIKKLVGKFSAYMLRCLRKHASTLVVCKVIKKFENGQDK